MYFHSYVMAECMANIKYFSCSSTFLQYLLSVHGADLQCPLFPIMVSKRGIHTACSCHYSLSLLDAFPPYSWSPKICYTWRKLREISSAHIFLQAAIGYHNLISVVAQRIIRVSKHAYTRRQNVSVAKILKCLCSTIPDRLAPPAVTARTLDEHSKSDCAGQGQDLKSWMSYLPKNPTLV